MATSTPRDALIHEIANAIESDPILCEVANVFRGFPSNLKFELPGISITASGLDYEKKKRTVYREAELESGIIETIFETSTRTFGGTIELWAKTKTSREPLEMALDALLEGGVPLSYGNLEPSSPGLVLDLSRLYDARVRVLLVDKSEQDASGGRDGYFRVLFSFMASVPYLVRVEYKKASFTNTADVENEEC
jgi:hypothetical protein